ncbi:MAG: ProQ/FinO family protein [Zoogloeaceae bacterium]|jgi:ProP effector|nr:ProQ/FinO family protein [Zoogloeaceae bacterium]
MNTPPSRIAADPPVGASAAESPAAARAESAASPAPEPGPREILKTLYARFPVFRAGEPLAIGIDKAVRAELPDLPRKSLRIALSIHTHSNRYLRNTAKARHRLDLQSAPAGEITESQRQYAAEHLRERLKKQVETAAATPAAAAAATPAAVPPASAETREKTPVNARRPVKATAPPPQTKKPPPPQKPGTAAPLSLNEKLALLSEKFSRK